MSVRQVDQWLRGQLTALLDAVAPVPCWFCGGDRLGGPACSGCLADLPWFHQPCRRCGQPGPTAGLDLCPACTVAGPRLFDRVWSPLAYEYPVDRLIAAAKFGSDLAAASLLGQLCAAGLGRPGAPGGEEPLPAGACLVPVPLHWRRHGERGYNQAEEMARALGRRLGLTVAAGRCRRVRATPPQSGLGARARLANLRGAFEVRRPWPGGVVILVDDVRTTGATARALGRVLRDAGVRELQLWTLARTVRRGTLG